MLQTILHAADHDVCANGAGRSAGLYEAMNANPDEFLR
jgi:hypothetical protein